MRLRMVAVPAVLLAIALPGRAQAGGFDGVVVAKQARQGTFLLAGPHGAGLTVRGGLVRARIGERVTVTGVRLHDGTLRFGSLRVDGRVRISMLRGTVVRKVRGGTLLASGRSVVKVHSSSRKVASADDHGFKTGDVVRFEVRFDDDDDLIQTAPPTQVGQAGTVRIEGALVSVTPLVVSLEELPVTIAVPDGLVLPTGLAAGQRIELTVQVTAANTFTLVSIDDDSIPAAQAQEVEVKGTVVSSTTSQIVVSAGGSSFTFVAPAGQMLPVLAIGTFVEARGIAQGGTTTLERLRVEDDGGGHDGGGNDGGGHGDGGSHH